jgi:hypothetical protein
MIIEQKTIQTKATSQGAPQDLNSIFNIKGGGVYKAPATDEYFLIFSDSPQKTEEILVNQIITSDFDAVGNELPDPSVEDIIEKASYFIRKFYIFRILNGELVEKNYIGEVYEVIGGGGNAVQSIENQNQIKFGKFKFADNDYTQNNLAGVFQPEYTKKTYLILSKIEEKTESPKQVQASPFENLCDIILAETIKSYLL